MHHYKQDENLWFTMHYYTQNERFVVVNKPTLKKHFVTESVNFQYMKVGFAKTTLLFLNLRRLICRSSRRFDYGRNPNQPYSAKNFKSAQKTNFVYTDEVALHTWTTLALTVET